MSKPQQPELRRSERVPALDPDASEAVLSAESTSTVTNPDGPVPEEQRPGHQPETQQDKPDMDDMAQRLGVVPEGDEPDDAPSVTTDLGDTTDEPYAITAIRKRRRALALTLATPAVAFVVIRRIVRRRRR